MKINLTKKEYETLAKLVYLGDWMVSAYVEGRTTNPLIKKYNDMHEFIFSLATQFGFSEHFEHELEYDPKKQTEIFKLIDEYDDETFWDELSDRLGRRDFFKKYSKEEIEKMDRDEYFMKMQKCSIAWEEELEDYGVERLGVANNSPIVSPYLDVK